MLFRSLSITKGLVQAPIGSCKRIFSGTSFWINNAFTDQLNDLMLNTVQEWISEGIWDNEQVALRYLELWKTYKIFLIHQGQKKTGQVANKLGNYKFQHLNAVNRVIHFALRN